jgi:hypothetical protein
MEQGGAPPGAPAHGDAAGPAACFGGRLKEDAMILVVFDPRTGERVTLVVAETAQGKRIVKTTRESASA